MRHLKEKKNILKYLLFSTSFMFLLNTNINTNAKSIDVVRSAKTTASTDITDISIIKSYSGDRYDMFNSTIETSDGGLVCVGHTNSKNLGFEIKGGYDSLIVKYNKNGELEWTNSFGGTNDDRFNSVVETPDGGFVAVGEVTSPNNTFGCIASMVKYSKDGTEEWSKTWGKSNNDIFESVSATSDGGYIVAGSSSSSGLGFTFRGSTDAILIKYDKDWNQQWIKSLSGTSQENFFDVKQTSDGGYIASGWCLSTGLGFTNNGFSDGILVKYSENGTQEWIRNFGGSDGEGLYSVIELKDGGYVAVGYLNSNDTILSNNGVTDGLIVKYSNDGTLEWANNFGGSEGEGFVDVIEMSDGTILALGYGESSDAGFTNRGNDDSFIVTYSQDGNQGSIKSIGGTYNDIANTILNLSSGEIFIAGASNSTDMWFKNKGDYDAFILKYNKDMSAEEELLLRELASMNVNKNLNDYFQGATRTSDGGFVIVGDSDSLDIGIDNYGRYDAIIVKYDKYKNQEWIKSIGGSGYDSFYDIIETQDKGLVAIGYTTSTDMNNIENKGSYDCLIVKYDKSGNEIWRNSFGGSSEEYFYRVIELDNGDLIAVGDSESDDAGFDTNNNGYYYTDGIIVKYSKDGIQEWVKAISGTETYSYDSLQDITKTPDGGFAVVGYAEGVELDDFVSADTIFSNGILIKYDVNGNREWIRELNGDYYDYFYSITATSDNGYVVVGETYSTNIDYGNQSYNVSQAVIIKYNSQGDVLWSKGFGGADYDWFDSVIEVSDGGYIATGESYSTDAGFENKGSCDAIIVKYSKDGTQEWATSFGGNSEDSSYDIIEISNNKVLIVISSKSINAGFNNKGGYDGVGVIYDITNGELDSIVTLKNQYKNNSSTLESIRDKINNLPEGELKEHLNDRLDLIVLGFGSLEPKASSANLDIYIKSENMLLMSLSTNQITFEDYSGVDDLEKLNALEISINSSLPYQLNAYLIDEMYNSDKSKKIDMDRLNIKDNEDIEYKQFTAINDKLVIKDNCNAGNNLVHNLDFKLNGGNAYEADTYKTVIRFEAEQK